jgi:hypothetical protein
VLLLAVSVVLLLASPASANPLKPFPEHWDEPPAIQTRDYVEWPGGYGHGSSTMANWISAQMNKDAQGGATEAPTLYAADFSAVPVGTLPEDFMVLNGNFAVREEAGRTFMELPGAPLDSYTVMFGPAGSEGVAVEARILGTSKGRRYPAFAVGLNGLGGYRLKLIPAKKTLELFSGPEDGGDTVATDSFAWKTGTWVCLKLQVRAGGEGQWHVEGKAWSEGSPEPTAWMVSHVRTKKPLPGRPFVEASPYAGTPIRFDELVVRSVRE